MTLVGATVTVWTGVRGIPERFVWDGRRYRVSDTPTALDVDYAAITHPPDQMPLGWRFQGTSDAGETRMFDVLFDESRQEWQLLHTYV
ncbi:hypothetical protein [Lacisediminihabitans changchengi]|uniref:Uncharacterized protein n=1 Tax=Lacisediminihabitans changchengi TaxID=2787634 RepID=A0A934SPG2_9MICO|nr:hypothetical protein [Lacisediminihabitans changchengi]MBK4346643.1 hypothetical protein [Lacisediminihabitans changchengi]